jgi:glutathione S-transferase
MQLLYSQTCPFARKVRILAHETGLASRLDLVPVIVSPVTVHEGMVVHNPLGKLPTLLLDEGGSLYESPVIVEYLDCLQGGLPLVPRFGTPRWTALRLQAAADGLLDAAILVQYETALRPAEQRSPGWVAGQMRKIGQTLDALEAEADRLGPRVTIGEIAVACALAYLDGTADDWRRNRPKLAQFYARFAERPSMQATRPTESAAAG